MNDSDTIAAIATAPGRSGIGVVKVSGKSLSALIAGVVGKPLPARRAVLSEFRDARGEVLDQGIALYFPAPHSYTGEEVLELQGHGGPIVLRLLLRRCLELGARIAEPGEFTKRAFLNGKLDLAQAESVADLIEAATAEAARSAVRSLQGAFSERIEALGRELIELRALVEATLDFPEEEIEFLERADAQGRLARVRENLGQVIAASERGSLLREGLYVVLAGQPNVGKSSLLNALAGEELAIVTEIPGTTRDAIRQSINVEGVPVHVIDTAGLRESSDPIEKIGMARTWAAIEKADVMLLVIDATRGEDAADQAILKRLPERLACIRIMNKIDLLPRAEAVERSERGTLVWLSAKTGRGVDLLRRTLLETVGWTGSGEGLFLARERHLRALEKARTHLERAAQIESQLEFFAEELRLAHEALGSITGAFTTEELLGEIFSRFCIGK
jgi:tRNA modification GTPase